MVEVAKKDGVYEIRGIIRSINDVDLIKSKIEDDLDNQITLKIVNSFMLPSSLIGFLMKQKAENNKIVNLLVEDENLYEMLLDLGLDREFHIKRV